MFPAEELVNEAVKTAEKIAGLSKIAVQLAKEAVNTGTSTSSTFPNFGIVSVYRDSFTEC